MRYVGAFILRLAAEAAYWQWRGGYGTRYRTISNVLECAANQTEAP